jgi:hypothetical protein
MNIAALSIRTSYSRLRSNYYSGTAMGYLSDVYTPMGSAYYPIVVWQFWGRAAEAS